MFVTIFVTSCYNCNNLSRATRKARARPRMSRTQRAQARTTTGPTLLDLRSKLGAKKEKSGGRRVAGLFRSLAETTSNHLSRTILRRRARCRQSSWRRRHRWRFAGEVGITSPLCWARLPWCCAQRHKRQSWCSLEVLSRLRAP